MLQLIRLPYVSSVHRHVPLLWVFSGLLICFQAVKMQVVVPTVV